MNMRWPVLLIVSITALAIALAGRAIDWDSSVSMPVPPRPNWYYPEPQNFISAWCGAREKHSLQVRYPEAKKQFERFAKVSDVLTDDSDQGDFSFFKKNSDGTWHTALDVGGEWNQHPWNVLTSEQIQEMKSRLDVYLLSVSQFGQPNRTWKTIPVGLKCCLIPIAFAPSVGSLLCLEPDSDLLFVLANNNDAVDVGTFNYCSSASDRLIVYPTNTRLQSVLDFGACNDKNILDEDRAISIRFVDSLIGSAGIGKTMVRITTEAPLWKDLRYSDVVGGGALILLILYALARTVNRARPRK